jgi:hypothetical protein
MANPLGLVPLTGTETPEGVQTWAILAKAQMQEQLPLTGEKQALLILKMLAPNGPANRAFLPKFDDWVKEQRTFSDDLAVEALKAPNERAEWASSHIAAANVAAAKEGKCGKMTPTTVAMFQFLKDRFGGNTVGAAEAMRNWKMDTQDVVRSIYALKDANDRMPANNRRAEEALAQIVLATLSEETHHHLRTSLVARNEGKPADEIVTLEYISLTVLTDRLTYLQRTGVQPKAREQPRSASQAESREPRSRNAHAAAVAKPAPAGGRGGLTRNFGRAPCVHCSDRFGKHAEEMCHMRSREAFDAAPAEWKERFGYDYEEAKGRVKAGTFYRARRSAPTGGDVSDGPTVRELMEQIKQLKAQMAKVEEARAGSSSSSAAANCAVVTKEPAIVAVAPARARQPHGGESRMTEVNGVPVPLGLTPLGPTSSKPVTAVRTGGAPLPDPPLVKYTNDEVVLRALGVEVALRKPTEPPRLVSAVSSGGAAFIANLRAASLAGVDLTKLRWLVDSGSDLSFIAKRILQLLIDAGLAVKTCCVRVEGATGPAPDVVGSVVEYVTVAMVDEQGHRVSGEVSFYVSDSQAYDVLLGTDAMATLKMDVLFSAEVPRVTAQGCAWRLRPAKEARGGAHAALVSAALRFTKNEDADAELLRCAKGEGALPGGGRAFIQDSEMDDKGGRTTSVAIYDSDGTLAGVREVKEPAQAQSADPPTETAPEEQQSVSGFARRRTSGAGVARWARAALLAVLVLLMTSGTVLGERVPACAAVTLDAGARHEANEFDVAPDVPEPARSELVAMLKENRGAFAFSLSEMSAYDGHEFRITLREDAELTTKLFQRNRRNHSKAEVDEMVKQCNDLYAAGMIEPAQGGMYASPSVLPRKKDGSARMCGDYRSLNAATVTDPYVMPTDREIFGDVRGQVFSTLDLFKGYNQLTIHKADRPKTAFWGGNFLWQWTRMPFGLKNAGAAFQRAIDQTLAPVHERARAYIDDVLIFTDGMRTNNNPLTALNVPTIETYRQHIEDVRHVIQVLKARGWRLNPKKCRFGYLNASFLGHEISAAGIRPERDKVQAINEMRAPLNVSELRTFLGMANYYARFVPRFSEITEPLRQLLRKNIGWRWGESQQHAFREVKALLTSSECLAQPDYAKPFIIQTDWSKAGLSAILSQLDDKGQERVIEFASRSCTPAESAYGSYKGEMLAVVWAAKHYRRHIFGQETLVQTDHLPLRWLFTCQELTGQYARWASLLSEYNLTIEHRAGVTNQNADALSRFPLPPDGTEAEDFDGVDDLPPGDSTTAGLGRAGAPPAVVRGTYPTAPTAGVAALALLSGRPLDPATRVREMLSGTAFNSEDCFPLFPERYEEAYCEDPRFDSIDTLVEAVFVGSALQATAAHLEDIFDDKTTLHFILHHQLEQGVTDSERRRVLNRAARYTTRQGDIIRVYADGTERVVPKPADREALVRKVHAQYGHYATRRTVSLLSAYYWWANMWVDVERVVRECPVCDRARAAPVLNQPYLTSLPIRGLGYRWQVDLFGPLPESPDGCKYVFVAIEAFSKWVEAIPIKTKTSDEAAAAMLTLIARYGACAEVVTDQGREFEGTFQELLTQCGIDHRRTSHNHPQSNGLAERAVQTIKACLRRLELERGDGWAAALPWVLLGYRVSIQAATRYSPYVLMYAREPVIPPAIMERITTPIDFEDPTMATRSLLERGMFLARHVPLAFGNLEAAQHQDDLRHRQRRSGAYRPAATELSVGQLVYLAAPTSGQRSLDVRASSVILRVVEARDDGILVLQGREGATCKEHRANVLPCHIPVDVSLDPEAVRRFHSDADLACERCNTTHSEAPNKMIICDHCATGWHQQCLQPVLVRLPARGAAWYCPYCVAVGRTWRLDTPVVSAASLRSATDVRAALSAYMPGQWSNGHATRLANQIERNLLSPVRVCTLPEEYAALAQVVDWRDFRTALDPWSGNGTTRSALGLFPNTNHLAVTLSDIDTSVPADVYGDALDPEFLASFSAPDVVVTSPHFAFLDLAIPLLCSIFAAAVVCVHVPGWYLTNMPEPRLAWFRDRASHVQVVSNLPTGPVGRRNAWVIIYADDILVGGTNEAAAERLERSVRNILFGI